jgi:S1/P1 Nuclease
LLENVSMPFFFACLCAVFLALVPTSLFAWGPIGHMTVAYVAYQNLTPAAKARALSLLRLNPDYATWDKQIPEGASTDDHDRMIFMMASIWPDDIKGESQYSDDGTSGGNVPEGPTSARNIGYKDLLRHRYWHFIDTPFSPDQTVLPPISAPNAQTQIAAFRAVLASSQPDELKSYDLVWLLHLVGDIHQPLHAVTRITQAHPKGDAGGNAVKLFGDAESNLHSYWDNLPGSDCKFCNDKLQCASRAMVLGKTIEPAGKLSHNLDAAVWARESFEDARMNAYREPIGSADQPYTIVPDSDYETQAYKLAKRRIAAAGARLADVLNAELK